jgi:bifunctional polynucleotide phosphatase/kinase
MSVETAVASFFTPVSQKPPEKIKWQERAFSDDLPNTLLVGKYVPANASISAQDAKEKKMKKVAAFDFVRSLVLDCALAALTWICNVGFHAHRLYLGKEGV